MQGDRERRGRGRPRGRDGGPVWSHEPRDHGRTTPRTRAEVVAAALAIADAEGFEAVSMRNVARRLGVGTMTLYSYIGSKDDLLDLMFDEVMGELLVPEPLPADWRDAITQVARRTRAVWLRHPWMAYGLGDRSSFGPNSMRHVEQSLAAIEPLGVAGVEAFALLGAIDDYTLGHAMRQIGADATLDRQGMTRAEWMAMMAPYWEEMIARGGFPRLEAAAGGDWELMPEERFERGLEWMIEGIAARYER